MQQAAHITDLKVKSRSVALSGIDASKSHSLTLLRFDSVFSQGIKYVLFNEREVRDGRFVNETVGGGQKKREAQSDRYHPRQSYYLVKK